MHGIGVEIEIMFIGHLKQAYHVNRLVFKHVFIDNIDAAMVADKVLMAFNFARPLGDRAK